MDNLIFELQDVHFSYAGTYPALCGIDFTISTGEKACIIGANGSGKSTFLQLLDGLLFAGKGRVKFCGRPLSEKDFEEETFSREFRRKVGFIFQNSEVQLFCPSVKEDIVFGPLNLGFERSWIEKRLEMLVEILNIGPLLERSPHQLSIGEKRKVAIASTLIIDPQVLILDEPTAGLDPLVSRQIIELLLQANAGGKTIITATHDLHIVEEISDKVYVFGQEKKIVRSGAPQEILADAVLLEENNLVHAHKHRHDDKVHAHPHLHLEHHHPEHP